MAMKRTNQASAGRAPFDLELDNLLHPAQAFEHPRNVVDDPDLTLNEKRAILASWASDACAIEAAPALRQAPGTAHPVRFDDVMDALRALDQSKSGHYSATRHYRRVLENRVPGVFGGKSARPRLHWPRAIDQLTWRAGRHSRFNSNPRGGLEMSGSSRDDPKY
jgi:hypothetical protein